MKLLIPTLCIRLMIAAIPASVVADETVTVPKELADRIARIERFSSRKEVEHFLGEQWQDFGGSSWNSGCNTSYVSRAYPGVLISIWYGWTGDHGIGRHTKPEDPVKELPKVHATKFRFPEWTLKEAQQANASPAAKKHLRKFGALVTRSQEFWEAQIAKSQGKRRGDVERLLPPRNDLGGVLTGGCQQCHYQLDPAWAVRITYDSTGATSGDPKSADNVVIGVPTLVPHSMAIEDLHLHPSEAK